MKNSDEEDEYSLSFIFLPLYDDKKRRENIAFFKHINQWN